jgi:two-component system, sensor histidine kinase RegB
MNVPAPVSDTRLKRLFWLRNVSLVAQILVALTVGLSFGIELPVIGLAVVFLTVACANLATGWRLRRPWPVGDVEILGQLALDVILLTAALHLTGGATNPFVTLFLLPLIIAVSVLPTRHSWAMVGMTIAAYTLLMFWYLPLGHSHESSAFGLHVLGMWCNFVASAVLIGFFVGRMAASLRARDLDLAAARERTLRDQQLIALGTFAAGAAHELGTPLSTIAVVVKDLEAERSADGALATDLRTLRIQVDACKSILTRLVERAGRTRSERAKRVILRDLIEEASTRWRLFRPASRLTVRYARDTEMPLVALEETMVQALVSLLNNAADASPDRVELLCNWSSKEVTLEIRDHGAGLSETAIRHAGRVAYSEKPGRGMGLGLLIARAAIERVGGSIDLRNLSEGGAATMVTLPITVAAA